MKRFKQKKIVLGVALLYVLSVAIRAVGIHNKWRVEEQTTDQGIYSTNYPIRFLSYKDQKAIVKDENGVYMIDQSKKTNFTKGEEVFYSPVAIGLGSLRDLQQANKYSDSIALKSFLINAKWLMSNQDSLGRIPFNTPVSSLDKKIEPPWYSALAQGLALSVFSRAYEISGDTVFCRAANMGLESFEIKIAEGGIMSSERDFEAFLEEYPTNPPMHVLNGFNYSILGLYDAASILKNQKAQLLFEKYSNVLADKISEFDLGHWSAYSKDVPSLRNHYTYCNPWYHKLHIVQLQVLYKQTRKEELRQYADEFRKDLKGPVPIILYPSYIVYSDAVWIMNFIKRAI
ncbi:hypothetical protein J4E06_08140 [Muricauda sp. NFXS6]|uniref:D-glucuronyl C5-epimerase family protein n=1 Tax=Allomuricauda sp. NFXS6 TaxID=2819094 RepID=UPI0032DF8EC9